MHIYSISVKSQQKIQHNFILLFFYIYDTQQSRFFLAKNIIKSKDFLANLYWLRSLLIQNKYKKYYKDQYERLNHERRYVVLNFSTNSMCS